MSRPPSGPAPERPPNTTRPVSPLPQPGGTPSSGGTPPRLPHIDDIPTGRKVIPEINPLLGPIYILTQRLKQHGRDLLALALFCVALLTLVGMLGWSQGSVLDAWTGFFWRLFGWAAVGVPFGIAWGAWLLIARNVGRQPKPSWSRILAAEAALFAGLGLLNLFTGKDVNRAWLGEGGGQIGWGLGNLIERVFPPPTDLLALGVVFLGGLFLALDPTAHRLQRIAHWLRVQGGYETEPFVPPPPRAPNAVPDNTPSVTMTRPTEPLVQTRPTQTKPKLAPNERVKVVVKTEAEEGPAKKKRERDQRLPGLELLEGRAPTRVAKSDLDLEYTASLIKKTLEDFGVPVMVRKDVLVGPNVAQFQVEPGFVDKAGAVDVSALTEALRALGAHVAAHPNLTEREVLDFALNEAQMFKALGYDAAADVLVVDRARAVLRAANKKVLASLEFRRPNKPLTAGGGTLEEKPDAVAFCNGQELVVHNCNAGKLVNPPLAALTLANLKDADARRVYNWLGKKQQWKVRVSQIASLRDDLALSLAASHLRIEAPVPGQSYVGIEVPLRRTSTVNLRLIIEAEAFQKINSPLAVALGRNVAGAAIAADLGKMPHLLIAGTTGSGKSICISSIIMGLVVNNTPEDLRLVLIDPKKVELIRFNGLPHLFGVVESDLDRITGVLRWVTREMDRRYKIFETVAARNLDTYHAKIARRADGERLPRMVVIIDELADLMMRAPDETERTLVRLAQMARATGIHLVVATQRPSTDIVTGLIKANFPARIAFAVASAIDSRVILDTQGAETLLGKGDMLFQAPDSPAPMRLQGCLVTDKEIDKIVDFWREQAALTRAETDLAVETAIAEAIAEPEPVVDENASPDELPEGQAPWEAMLAREAAVEGKDTQIEEAIAIVKKYGTASASLLQRKMRLGYPRAARLMDELREMGVIGREQAGGKTREVFVRGEDDPIGEEAARKMRGEEEDEEEEE